MVFGGSLLLSLRAAQVDPRVLFAADARANVARFVRGMFPPDLSPAFLRFLAVPVVETIQISIAGTALAVLIGLPLGLLATSTLTWSGVLHERRRASARALGFVPYAGARALLSVFRSIPEFVWAFMFVRAVGLGPFPGVLALGFHTGGVLGKLFGEVLEDVGPRPLEALQAAGASRPAVLLDGIVPQAIPQFFAYALYRWEVNIRAAAVLGFVGAGGLGQRIHLAISLFLEHQLLTLILAVYLMVTLVDASSGWLRRRIV